MTSRLSNSGCDTLPFDDGPCAPLNRDLRMTPPYAQAHTGLIIRHLVRSRIFILTVLIITQSLTSCSAIPPVTPPPPSQSGPAPIPRDSTLDQLRPIIEPELQLAASRRTPDPTTSPVEIEKVPARFKQKMAIEALTHPWNGFTALERQGLLFARLAEGGAPNLPALLDALEAGMDRSSKVSTSVGLPTPLTREAALTVILQSVELAASHRSIALNALSSEERAFLFRHTADFAEHFTPQHSPMSAQTMTLVKSNRRFLELLAEHVDYPGLIAAARVLAQLGNEEWLSGVANAFRSSPPIETVPPGITGDVLFAQQTPYGLVIIGGSGPNTYDLDGQCAFILDLGGDDHYRGIIGASGSSEQGNAAVIDLLGDDTYIGDRFGLATGRLGVGLVIDHAGNDRYQLEEGSGGAGFAGLGILLDSTGNDTYTGSRFTQGAAIGGLGLLVDLSGNDRYSSHGYAIGFGGPLGIGAVIDVAGDDAFQCGNKYPSAYNAADAPASKPGDPLFQYECFGLGAGSGSRILTKRPEWQAYNLAGGWGMLIDIDGKDLYDSANFSQGIGYYFGLGMKMDFGGDDIHRAARYGHGASAHYGIGLFLDRMGRDHYSSTGPFYNGGVAWDHSVSLAVDAGKDQDTYAFERSTGLGRADYSSWGVFVDEGGTDHYHTQSGWGTSLEFSFAGFFDLNGDDTYTLSAGTAPDTGSQPGNARRINDPNGGLFLDR